MLEKISNTYKDVSPTHFNMNDFELKFFIFIDIYVNIHTYIR